MTTALTVEAPVTPAQRMERVIARNVRFYLSARGLQQASLAEPMGIKPSALSQKMTGRITWSVADLVNAARFLGVKPEDLMDDALIEQIDRKYGEAPADTRPRLLAGAPSGIRTLDTLIKSQLL